MKNKIAVVTIVIGMLFSNLSCAQSAEKGNMDPELPKVEEVFQSTDKNDDGKLEKSELIGFVSNDFDKLDVDKDGFLSMEELAKSSKFQKRQRPNNQSGERPTSDRLIAEMDVNKDGKLSKTEVRGPLVNDFSKIDSNTYGFLTKEELEKTPKPDGQRLPKQ